MSIGRRIEKLEAALPSPTDGHCFCGDLAGKVIRIYDGPNSEGDADRDTEAAPPCEKCGGELDILKIVVVELQREAA